jgi:hypothetical protein
MHHPRRPTRLLLVALLTAGCAAKDKSTTESPASAANANESAGAEQQDKLTTEARGGERGRGLGPSGPAVLIGAAASPGKTRAALPDAPQSDEQALLVAIDTPYEIFSGQGSYVHVAAWRTSGAPAASARVYVGGDLMGQTDAHGAFVFIYPPPGRAAREDEALEAQEITVVDAQDARIQGVVPFEPMLRTASFASDQLYAYTDRGVYRPGEQVHVRLIGWHLEEDYHALEGAPLEVLLRDPAGVTVAGGVATTDADGVAAIDLLVPARGAEGIYNLEVAYKEGREQARIQVRAFKPPTLQLTHTLGRFITKAQAALSFGVTARSATGQPLKRADITVALEVGGAPAVVLKHTLRDEATHTFTLTPAQLAALKAAGDRAPSGAQDTWISARITVTDARGRRDELVRELRYVVSPAVAILEADKAQYGTGEVAQVIARVRDLDGAPMRGLALTLKGPSADQQWRATTDEQGTAQLRVPMPASSQQLQLYMEGVEAPIAAQELEWVAARPMAAQVEQPILRERQRAKILVRFPEDIRPVERVVHLDVVDTSGAIVQSALLKIEETPQGPVARGEFEAPSWGTMLVTLFALGKPAGAQPSGAMAHHQLGLVTEGQSLVVHPDKTLEILLDGVPDRASPGQLLQIKPRVRTPQGKEVDASLGVALVDGRTLALRDPLEVTPMDQLYAPTLRTMSTTGAQILSWPVVSRNWGDGQQDIALPPFPFMEGGAVTHREPRVVADALGDADGDAEEEGIGVITGHGSGAGMGSTSKGVGGSSAKQKKSIKLDEQMIEGKIQKPAAELIGSSDAAEEPDAAPARPTKARAQGAPQITIRTRFTDTSVWLPRARSGLGQPAFAARMPDTISAQELLVVASDRDGGVGVARHTIQIEQALWVQADLPAVLRAGEAVDVPVIVANDGDAAREVTVSFEAREAGATLRVSKLTLAARERRVILVRVAPTRAGAIPYKLAVSGGGAQDISEATLRVIPGGLSTSQTQRGAASAASAAKLSWTTPAQGAQATLSVVMPSTAFATMELGQLGAQLADDPLSVASDLTSASLLLRYTQRHAIQSPALGELRERVLGAVGQLRFAQGADGSFAYWRNGQPGAFVTAWALEGLLEAQALDVAVPQDTILRAAEWLATRIEADGSFKVGDIAFWEGDGAAVREGVGAEVFHVLTLLPASSRTPPVVQAIERLQARYVAYLKGATLEPLATGRAIMALSRQGALDKAVGARALRGLLAARRDAHWEPSWFHAWGGMVELNAALLMAMQAVDPAGFAVEQRDVLSWVLSTRATWGRWHHERDTAAGLRALLALGAPAAQAAGEVTVLLDGAPLKKVTIDAADPFLSALELAALELPPLAPGAHTLEVRSTSALAASVALQLDTPLVPAMRAASSGALKLSVSAPARGAVGAEAVMVIKAQRSDKAALPGALRIATSGLAQLELAALARTLEGDARVVRARMDAESLWIELAPQTSEVTFNLPMTLVRSGQGRWPAVSFTRGADAVAVSAGELVVEE